MAEVIFDETVTIDPSFRATLAEMLLRQVMREPSTVDWSRLTRVEITAVAVNTLQATFRFADDTALEIPRITLGSA